MIEFIVRGLFVAQLILIGAKLFGWLTISWGMVFWPGYILVALFVIALLIVRIIDDTTA